MSGNLDLTISVPADEWAYMRRRVVYLEALLVRLVRDSNGVREWFTAGELAVRRLPGLADNPEAVTRKAQREKWMRRKTRFDGRWLFVYHVSSLPARAFDALVSSILNMPTIDEAAPLVDVLPEPPPPLPVTSEPNTAPPWVLPLMRIMKTETGGDLREAWQRLPDRLPPDMALPTVEEAAAVLVRFGIAGRQ